MTSHADLPNLMANIEQMRRMNEAWAAAGNPLAESDEGWRKVADIYGCSVNDLRDLRDRLAQQPPATAPFSAEEIAAVEARLAQVRPTATLNDGTVVLAKLYKGKPSALTYANRSQANKAAARVQGEVIGRRPFYVRVPKSAT